MSRNTPFASPCRSLQSVLRLQTVPFCGSLMSATELHLRQSHALLFSGSGLRNLRLWSGWQQFSGSSLKGDDSRHFASYSSPSSSPTLQPRMLSVGALVWISCRPLLKMSVLRSNATDLPLWIIVLICMWLYRGLCTLGGFWLARQDVFTPMAAKGASQVILVSFRLQKPCFPDCEFAQNITLPALFFSKMVPSFNVSNITALGELQFISHTRDPSTHLFLYLTTSMSHIQLASSSFGIDIVPVAGPIVLVVTLYQLYGLILAFSIKQLFWVPHRFRYGIYMAAGWGNYGDVR